MDLVNQLFPAFAAGVSGAALRWLWRKVAARSATWFPVLKRTAGLVLWAWAIGSALCALYSVMNATDPQIAICGLLAGFCAPTLFGLIRSHRKGGDDVKHGTHVASVKTVNRAIKALKKPVRLLIGGVRVPFEAEPHNMLVAGSAGAGKSALISSVLDQLREAGDTVIVVDSGGEFLSKHFSDGTDFVFNPFDDRCVNWSPDFEMQGEWDADALARSMIPDDVGANKERNNDAQTFVAAVLRELLVEKRLNLPNLLYYVQVASISELRALLGGTPVMAQLASDSIFSLIRTVASNYLTPYSYLPNNGTPFSVGEMIRAEHSGFLFLTFRADQLASQRSLISCVLDVAARTILSLSPDIERRVWLVVDDFASIGRIQSLETMAKNAHKVGGCLLIGLQSFSTMRALYGDAASETILSNLASRLVLRCADAGTAQYLSKYIDKEEPPQQSNKSKKNNKNKEASAATDSTGQAALQAYQPAVLPSHIQALPALQGFLRLGDNLPVSQITVEVPKKARAPKTDSFNERDFKAHPMLKLASSLQTPLSAAAARAQAPAAPSRKPQTEPAALAQAPSATREREEPKAPNGSFNLRRPASSAQGRNAGPEADTALMPSLVDDGSDFPADSKVLVTRGAAPLRMGAPLGSPASTEVRKTLNNVTLKF